MKKMRRLMALALTLVMLATCVPFAFAEEATTPAEAAATGSLTDVGQDQVYYDAVKTLNVMGIINGYPDGTFGPDKNVTRAEFTAMLMRTLKLGSLGSTSVANLPFTDVSENDSSISWAIPDINTAYAKGAINGYEDQTFRPSANVAYEEAIKMIVATLGYTADASATPWYAGYLTIANQRGITKTASKLGAPGTPATRACIAQLLYDSLEVKLVESGEVTDKTILSDYLGYKKCTGVVYSNDTTSLISPDINLRDDEIMIYAKEEDADDYELNIYTVDDDSIKDYIGYELDFYYVVSGSNVRTLLFSVLKSAEPVVINAANVDFTESDDTTIEYFKELGDRNTVKLELESDNVVIYNGKLYGSDAEDSVFEIDMIPEIGQVKFIDSDGNEEYDVIDITAYDVYYVSTKATATYEIIDNLVQSAANKTLKLDTENDRNLTIVDADGKKISFSSIATSNIICVAKSREENGGDVLTKAIVVKDKVTGAITAVNDEKLTIGNKEYLVSNAAPWITGANDKLEAPANGDSGTFYLDLNGDIVAYSKNSTSASVQYGYVVAYSMDDEDFESDAKFRVLNSKGTTVYLGTNRTTKVDGEPCTTGDAVVEALEEAADNGKSGVQAVQQLIKYTTKTTNGETVFDEIYTAVEASAGNVEADELKKLKTIDRDSQPTYDSTAKTLKVGDAKINISGATIITIPENGKYDDFKKASASSFRGSYGVEAYDVSATNVPKIILVYGGSKVSGIEDTTPIRILDSMSEAKNNDKDGEVMWKLSGFYSSSSTTKGEFDGDWVSDESESSYINDLEKGDIFRAAKDDDGYFTFKDDEGSTKYVEYLYKIEDAEDYFGVKGSLKESSYYGVIVGSVIAVDDETNTFSVAHEYVEQMEDDEEPYDSADMSFLNVSDFKDAAIFVYTETKDGYDIEEGDYESAILGLNAQHDGLVPSKVLIFKARGKYKMLIVLPE